MLNLQHEVKMSAFIIYVIYDKSDKSDCSTFICSVLSFHATYQPQPQESCEYLGFLILKYNKQQLNLI